LKKGFHISFPGKGGASSGFGGEKKEVIWGCVGYCASFSQRSKKTSEGGKAKKYQEKRRKLSPNPAGWLPKSEVERKEFLEKILRKRDIKGKDEGNYGSRRYCF